MLIALIMISDYHRLPIIIYLNKHNTFMHFCSNELEQFIFAAPASPPTNVTGHAVDSTTIALSWGPPQPGDRNGIIRSYNISVTETDTGRQFSRTSVNTVESFHALHPFYVYIITITATTVASGPPSPPIAVQTDEDCNKLGTLMKCICFIIT